MSAITNSPSTQNTDHSLLNKVTHWLAKQLTNKDSFSAYMEQIIQLFRPEWRFNKAASQVVSIQHETKHIYTLTLKPHKKWKGFIAGQYIFLTVEVNGRTLTRPFSISSAPRDFAETGFIEVTIRAQDKGSVTPWMKESLKSGDTVYISEAMGEFCLTTSTQKRIFIAGGSGITPIRSMLNEARDTSWIKEAHLFFYFRNANEAFFDKDLNTLKSKGLNVHVLYSDEVGFFSLDQLKASISEETLQTAEYYICGPSPMIELCVASLEQASISQADIHFEYFGKAPSKQTLNTEELNEFIQVDYLDSRKQVRFSSGTVSKTLLELAEEEGLKPVSGCRMGICHQCICKKKQGRVFNTKTGEYSDTGAEDIQLCLSIPVGDVELEL